MDNAATTKVFEVVIQRMNHVLRNYYGNPSSSYRLGKEAQGQLKKSRCGIAQLLGCSCDQIIFT